ncbi:hypothetical protein [Halorussus salinus]|nr:hypothetical protein [Halorussus salinus]
MTDDVVDKPIDVFDIDIENREKHLSFSTRTATDSPPRTLDRETAGVG